MIQYAIVTHTIERVIIMKFSNIKIFGLIILLGTVFGCSFFLPQSWHETSKNLCQESFWQKASQIDLATILYPNHSCSKDKKIIHLAAQHASPRVLREFLKADVDVNAKDGQGYSALILAARFQRYEATQEILTAGANVNKTNKYGNTALSFAARFGSVDIVKELIDCGADVNISNNIGNTPLIRASHFGHARVVKELIAAKADIHTTNKAGESALSLALKNGHTQVIQQLTQADSSMVKITY